MLRKGKLKTYKFFEDSCIFPSMSRKCKVRTLEIMAEIFDEQKLRVAANISWADAEYKAIAEQIDSDTQTQFNLVSTRSRNPAAAIAFLKSREFTDWTVKMFARKKDLTEAAGRVDYFRSIEREITRKMTNVRKTLDIAANDEMRATFEDVQGYESIVSLLKEGARPNDNSSQIEDLEDAIQDRMDERAEYTDSKSSNEDDLKSFQLSLLATFTAMIGTTKANTDDDVATIPVVQINESGGKPKAKATRMPPVEIARASAVMAEPPDF